MNTNTFEAWWVANAGSYDYTDVLSAAIDAWNAATLAERERCINLVEQESDSLMGEWHPCPYIVTLLRGDE